MTRAPLLAATILLLSALAAGAATPLSEPRLRLAHGAAHQQPQVALTLDACSGKADQRIFEALVANRIPATVFVTARWLRRNGDSLKLMLAHPDLFQIENHGARHVPAISVPMKVYGLATAGSPALVKAEVEGGRDAILAATGHAPRWFRGATGRYDTAAMAEIRGLGEAIAGYTIRADDGATLPAAAVAKRLAAAKDGDVIIAHVNKPERPSGAGVVTGILALKAKGFVFVKLGAPPSPAPLHGS
ncbi:polysaccharide deacetylase [Aestuariivirga litoralis]|uniref:Chitooligosaccharide deacetylase n=1 Tax=Aestuariivirga litoralis TaxID=2650924 RepID=A0A2W2BYN4_9HYPH|nr:polysaccharide deacetylase family protein [Aestuariivirga litoralis]PZF78576.1 polysaccharide deacetylase [Aestuariivirga litoralis]